MTRKSWFLWILLLATPLSAQTPRSIEPPTGSTAGGEVVLIHGDFGTWPPTIRFGPDPEPVGKRYNWPYEIGYTEIADLPAGVGTLRITIEPGVQGSRLWAFNSVTNNETQHITLISPQR